MTDSNSGQGPDRPQSDQPGPDEQAEGQPRQQPPAYPGYGQQPGTGAQPPYGAPPQYGDPAYAAPQYGTQPYGGQPYGAPHYGAPAYGGPSDPDRRPGSVTAAAVLTWVFGGIALVFSGFLLLSVLAARDEFIEELEQDERYRDVDISADTFADAIAILSVVALVLSVLAIVLATMAYKRSKAGRAGLIFVSALTAVLSLPLSLGVVGVPWLVASVATIVMLAGKAAGDWYNRRTSAAAGGGWPPPGAPQA